MSKTLKTRLVDFLTDNPSDLKKIYKNFSDESQTTIRGRLNENLNKCFKRVARGVYIACLGDAKALIIEGDAWEVLPTFDDNVFDAIITDHGYTCMNDFVSTGTTRKKKNQWSFKTKDIDLELLSEFFRVLKPGGHFFCFLPADSAKTLGYNNRFMSMAMTSGFTFNKRFIWNKMAMGMGYNGRAKYEQILFLSKEKRIMPYDRSIPDLLSHKRIPPVNRIHEAEKPVELIEDIVKFSTKEGDVILDAFGGSMSTAKACLRRNRNNISIEICHEMIDVAVDHMDNNFEIIKI